MPPKMGGMRKLKLCSAIYIAALCQAQPGQLVAALNFELPSDGSIPEWIELIPAGQVVTGRDGRTWKNPDPQAIVERTRRLGRDIPVDIEHATELKAPQGEPAPAVGWINEMEVRDGAVWGRVKWNDHGRYQLVSGSYRYISPVFMYSKGDRVISHIASVGLTNQPNLFLTALNREQNHQEDSTVNELLKALCAFLGLPTDLDFDKKEEQDKVMAALNQMKSDLATARNSANNPSLEKFVPRSDYDTALNRAKTAEESLAKIKSDALEAEIETAINSALAAGKITPASVDYHKAQCRAEGGLDRFKAYAEASPVVCDPSDLGQRKPGGDEGKALNAEQRKVAEMMGLTEEDLKKYG